MIASTDTVDAYCGGAACSPDNSSTCSYVLLANCSVVQEALPLFHSCARSCLLHICTDCCIVHTTLKVNRADLEAASAAVGVFGADNRAGIPGTLHRISAIRNRKGTVVGLTCRVGRAVSGHVDLIQDILEGE